MVYNSKIRIKLINPPVLCHPLYFAVEPTPPLGPGILMSVLRKSGYEAKIDDILIEQLTMNMKRDSCWRREFPCILSENLKKMLWEYIHDDCKDKKVEALIDKLIGYRHWDDSEVIGISVLSRRQMFWSLVIAWKIKKHGIPVVFGGAYMAFEGYRYFEKDNIMDYLIVGHAEESFIKFIQFIEGREKIENVPGLFYKRNGGIHKNPLKTYSIEQTPIPDFNGVPLDLYKIPIDPDRKMIVLPYQISEGCFNKCNFCSVHRTVRFQYKTCEKVILELEQLTRDYHTCLIQFLDSNIFFSYEYLDKICTGLIKKGLGIKWGVTMGVADAKRRAIDYRLFKKMEESGCRHLNIGIETGSDRLRKAMNKPFTTAEYSRLLKESHEAGIINTVNFIAGYPSETNYDIDKTTQFIKEHARYIDGAAKNTFFIDLNSPLGSNPELFGIRIIGMRNLFHRYLFYKYRFKFEEMNGLPWKDKKRQMDKSIIIITRACYKYIVRPKLNTNLYIPLWLFNLLMSIRRQHGILYYLVNIILSFFGKEKFLRYQHPYLYRWRK